MLPIAASWPLSPSLHWNKYLAMTLALGPFSQSVNTCHDASLAVVKSPITGFAGASDGGFTDLNSLV